MHSPELPIEPFALFFFKKPFLNIFFLGIIIVLNTAKKIKKITLKI